jgi:23S rRNA (uracil1939-C5)-methyltransferase
VNATAGAPVRIDSLAAGGSGVGRLADGMAVFVPRTAPGDLVRLTAVRRHRRHAEARLLDVLEPGPSRCAPACAHFIDDRCGGCQWQHVGAAAQGEAKRRIVGDALRRLGRLAVPDPPLVHSPRPLAYRTTVTLTVRWTAGGPVAGFHDALDPDRVFALDRCAIARPELDRLWQAVRGRLDCLPHGDDVRLKLRLAPDDTLHLVVSGGDRAWADGTPLERAAGAAGVPVTVWWQPGRGAVRRVAGVEADPSAVAFEQVNAEVAAQLRAAVLEAAREVARPGQPLRVLDLYAGAGDTALPLAAEGHDVALVEVDGRAVARAQARAAQAGVTLRCVAGHVEDRIAALLPADVVIANPPRTGLGPEVAERLFNGGPARLVYVSCDPATLARDLVRLHIGAGRIVTLRAYDMFPQTSHVETLVVADRTGG